MPPATGAVAILPIIALWLVNACQEGAGMSALNSELTRKHAATNLQHLMTLPPPVAGDGTDPASEKRTESIHYLHNITHPDGAHDLVHYNVSSEVGLGLYPIVTLQYSSTALYQVSDHIQYLFFESDNRILP